MKQYLILALLALSTLSNAQDATGLSDEVIESIENRIAYGINPSIAIGIIDENGPRYFSFGSKTLGGDPVNEHTIYEIGSISKTFTAALLAYMVGQDKMDLDDAAQAHLPKSIIVPARGKDKITLGHLADHTSGLPRMPDNFAPTNPLNPYADYTVQQMYDFVSEHELQRDIGSEYEYSNLAQGLLGHILELESGKSYEDLMIAVIADPLGMKETKVTFDAHMLANLAMPYSNGAEVENWDIPALAGAGAIRSSVHDMLKYLSAQLGLTDTPLRTAMDLTQTVRHDKAGGTRVGLGWHMVEGSLGDIITHTGGTGGYLTFAGFVRETNTGVVVFTNSTSAAGDIGLHMLDPDAELSPVKQPITTVLRMAIDEESVETAVDKFKDAWENDRDSYAFDEGDINSLGYYYMNKENLDAALAIFKLNIATYPDAFNPYDSYGEALLKNGQTELAIENYKRSIEINPGNVGGIAVLEELGVEVEGAKLKFEEEVLAKHVGIYELAPGFNIDVTHENGQLYIQATGQQRFEIYPTSEIDFYLTVVNAQIKFHRSDSGDTESMTLFQGGQEIPGKRVNE